MILLALDTSASLCAAVLFDSAQEKVLARKSEDIGRGHAERLMGLLAELLDQAALQYKDVQKIAVTTGPGSFTGIRVGLATVRGLALGLGIPVVGVSVFDAIAFHYERQSGPLVVAMDAKRSEVFMQSEGQEPLAVLLAEIGSHLPKEPFRLAGSAAQMIVDTTGRNDITVCSTRTAAEISDVARLAAKIPETLEKPKPLYMRHADAKPQNNFAVALAGNVPVNIPGSTP